MTGSLTLQPLGADNISAMLLGGSPQTTTATTTANNSSGSSVFGGGTSGTMQTTTAGLDPTMFTSSYALSSNGLGLGLGLDPMSMGYDYGGAYMSQLYNNPYYLPPETIKEWEALPPEERARKYQEHFEKGQRIEAERKSTNREIQQQDAVETARVEREGRLQIQQEQNEEAAPQMRINGAAQNLFDTINDSREDDIMAKFCELVQAIIDDPKNNTPDGKPISLENARQLAIQTMSSMLKETEYQGDLQAFIRDKCSDPGWQSTKAFFGGNVESNETIIAQMFFDGKIDGAWTHLNNLYVGGKAPTLAENMEAFRNGGREGIDSLRDRKTHSAQTKTVSSVLSTAASGAAAVATAGAAIGAAAGVWFAGAGAIPGAILGGAIGALCGAVGSIVSCFF